MTAYVNPEFIDHKEGNTLGEALRRMLGARDANAKVSPQQPPGEVRIATAYFNPAGFAQIANDLESVPVVRLLLGADLESTARTERKRLDESETAFEQRRMRIGLESMHAALRRDRDQLPFNRTSGVALRKLVTALDAGNMEVRRYEHSFLHAKAYILTSPENANGGLEGLIAGSSNLTGAGLTRNLELNLGRYETPIIARAVTWFDDLWDEASPYDLGELFEESLRPRTPWEIFIRVLWQLYGNEVNEDAITDGDLPLTSFQKHGAARALRLIRNMGGAIVADEVGLGKTFIAGEVLQIYRRHRQRALLICPAALRDSTWRKFLTRFQVFVECLSFEELASDVQLQDQQRPRAEQQRLQRPLDEYQLVVVDEAHNYRNPDAPTRAAALRRLLFGQRRDLLLLTATPVNNSLWDLFHLLRFFVRQDGHLADRGILSIRQRFEQAMREDPSNLSPDLLYPIIDATTVKRTRQFVKKHYAGDNITGPEGRPVPIVFPQPRALSVRYKLEDLLPGFFDRLEEALNPDGAERISFARYMPDTFLLDAGNDEDDARSHAMVGLLRSGLLKRFESSPHAFRKTVEKMIREHSAFLEALAVGHIVTSDFMKELSADDDTVFEDVLAGTEHRREAELYDTERLRTAVERDRETLVTLGAEAASITPKKDPKLKALAEALAEIAAQAEREATDGVDESQRRKVIVFSFFEDTIVWVRDFLRNEIDARIELAGYRGRIVAVSGSGDLDDQPRHRAVQGFAPISMEAPPGADTDRYDLMLSTDVLAEGVNLQQCRHIINFDVPWNPMRLVQRHGRIDRIGSPHPRVFMRTIFPADRLNDLLNLEQRILTKLAMAAASVGVAAPIEGAAQGTQVFTETRDEIEKLLEEDASIYERGGTAGAAQTGEEYRQTLRKALNEERERIVNMPWKVGSGMVKGTRRGMFFCAVVGERTYLRFVAGDEEWGVSTADDSVVREVGTCLRLIECEPYTPTWFPALLQERVYDFWEAAQRDIWEEWMRETDPANLQPRVRPLNLRVAEFIRANAILNVPEEELTRALDILESPWPRREEIMLRQWFEEGLKEDIVRAREIVERVHDSGLEPAAQPPLLPPIIPEDIELLCWLGIQTDV